MTARSRTRLERVRASVGIACLASSRSRTTSPPTPSTRELAAILRELIEDTDPPGGLIPALAQLVAVAARRAEQVESGRCGDASHYLHDSAALLTDNAGARLLWAARTLDPQGDPV
ncbi:hypothetical protein ACWGVR_29210 [Streptomyces xanthophaeus]